MEQTKLIAMQEEEDTPPSDVCTVVGRDGKPHFIGMGRAADWLGVGEQKLRALVLNALLEPECYVGRPPDDLINRTARAFPRLFVDPFRMADGSRRIPEGLAAPAAAQ